MLTFIGEYNCKADSKFRISVPAMFRKVAASDSEWVVRRNALEKCVDMCPLSVWQSRLEELSGKLQLLNKTHADFIREYCRGVFRVETDSNGRVLLPKSLLESVGIDRDMVFAGVCDKIQIWNPEHYEAVKMAPEALAELVQEIFK